jgi:hypothetical protein
VRAGNCPLSSPPPPQLLHCLAQPLPTLPPKNVAREAVCPLSEKSFGVDLLCKVESGVDEGCGYEAEVSAGSLALESKPPEEGSGVLAGVRDEPQEKGRAVCSSHEEIPQSTAAHRSDTMDRVCHQHASSESGICTAAPNTGHAECDAVRETVC